MFCKYLQFLFVVFDGVVTVLDAVGFAPILVCVDSSDMMPVKVSNPYRFGMFVSSWSSR